MLSVELDSARQILAGSATFRKKTIHIRSIYRKHPEEKCFLVQAGEEERKYKVRFSPPRMTAAAANELAALRILHENDVEWAPKVVEYRDGPPAFLLTEYVSGGSLDKSLRWIKRGNDILRGLQADLHDMHAISGEYFGNLAGPPYASWPAFIWDRLEHHVAPLLEAGILDKKDYLRICTLWEAAAPALAKVEPTFLHFDVKPANIIFDLTSRRTTLIDFELARFGDIDFEWLKLDRLALRWPEYRKSIALPLLTKVSAAIPTGGEALAKQTLYDLYHVLSMVAFAKEHRLPIPQYRWDELHAINQKLRAGYS